jgi:hypothetical protein
MNFEGVDTTMGNKTSATVLEMVAAGKNRTGIQVIKLNEPNMRLMAEASLNLYKQ